MASGAAGEADGKASGPSRASNWSTEETKAVIAVWADEDTQTAADDPFTRNKKIYGEIAKQLTAMGYKRNASQVKYKLQSLKQRYKKIVDSNRRSGRGRTTWEYFEALDRILGARPAVNPPHGQIIESGTSGKLNFTLV